MPLPPPVEMIFTKNGKKPKYTADIMVAVMPMARLLIFSSFDCAFLLLLCPKKRVLQSTPYFSKIQRC